MVRFEQYTVGMAVVNVLWTYPTPAPGYFVLEAAVALS